MKKFLTFTVITTLLLLPMTASAEQTCKVEVCNKLERFTLDPWSMIKDSLGEVCMNVVIAKEDAVVGKELSSESRWYQGSSLNPTKKSVTRVKKVHSCT